MADEIRINGNVPSWASITVKLGERRYTGFTSISYGDSRERVKLYGMGRSQAPRGRSVGKYTTDVVSMTGAKDTVEALRTDLASDGPDGVSMGDTEFEIVVEYVEADFSIVDVIEGCVLSKNAVSHEENADPLKEDIEIDCMRIRWNGRTLFDESDGT